MSETVKTTCERCGTVDVPLADVRVDVPVRAGEVTVADFTCPGCARPGRQVLSERATLLLLHAGVEVAAASGEEVRDLDDSGRDPGRCR